MLIYKGQGISINDKGELQAPPSNLRTVEDLDEELISKTLKPVQRPIEFGLYRWSMEEDIMLLKAVPLMGRMYAEIGKRFIPHRDRGALRKRYQVLERRVKGALKRDKKSTNDIVRKNVAPLIEAVEAISKKGPLPVHPSSGGFKLLATNQNTLLQRYNMNVGKQTALPPKLPISSKTAMKGQQPNQSLPKIPQAPNNVNQSNNDALLPIATVPESPLHNDNVSQHMFEKMLNGGEYSGMSSFMEDRTKEALNSSTNHSLPLRPLPNFQIDNSCSGLSMLSSADLKASNMGTTEGGNETGLLSSVFGLPTRAAAQPFASPSKAISSMAKDDYPSQSLDGFNFSNLPSVPLTGDSQHAFHKDESLLRTPTSHYYSGTPHGFSHFPNSQESNFFIGNSLMMPDHYEVDAAATLSQMSNSSANFAANFLSPKKAISSSPAKSKTSSQPSLFQQVTKKKK